MLTDKLREGAHGKVFKILFWIIILSFIFAGVGNYLIPRLNTDPVEIGDIKIPKEQWDAQYQDQVRMMQRQYGAQVNSLLEDPNYVKALRLQVLERIIDNVAINSVTYEQGIRIGDKQVKDTIRQEKAFFKDGKFNNDLFLATVRNMGSSPDYYAQQLRTSIAADTLIMPIIRSGAIAYPYEIDELAKLFTQKRVVDVYTPNSSKIAKEITITDEQAKAYYDKNHKEFMKPATASFSYIVLSVDKLKEKVEVTEAALADYFNHNQSDFEVPQKRECSQILIKSTTPDFEAKANEALTQLVAGKDFEEVGLKYSDDKDFKNSKGSLGQLEKGSLSKDLDIALFTLKDVGQYSKVIVDEYGAHILRLDKIIDAFTPKLAEIKEEVKTKFIETKAQELYAQKSATLTDVSYESPDSLEAAAKAIDTQILQSGEVKLGDKSLKWPLSNPEVQKLAFSENNRTSHINSNVINLDAKTCFVLNVSDYQEPALQKFETVKDEALELAKADAVAQKEKAILEEIKQMVSKGETVAENDDFTVSKDVTVARSDNKFSPMFNLNIFAITDKVNAGVIANDNKVVKLAVLKSVETAKDEETEEFAKFIRTQLVQFKQNKLDSMITSGARDLCDIEYDESAINLVIQQDKGQN